MKKDESIAIEYVAYGLIGVLGGALIAMWVTWMAFAARLA